MMDDDEYILIDRKPVRARDHAQFIEHWRDRQERWRVAYTDINDDCNVSTIFLGLDHNYGHRMHASAARARGQEPSEYQPIVFETMVFGGPANHAQWRYRTWDEAVAGHAAAVEMCRGQNVVSLKKR
jgi:hypothetical protein